MSDKTNKLPVTKPIWQNKKLISGIVVLVIAISSYGGFKYYSNNKYRSVPKRAIEAYKTGVAAIEKNDPEKALDALFLVDELDNTFADAQARIAEAYFLAAMKHKVEKNTAMQNNMLSQSLTFVSKALSLDASNGLAHMVLGYHAYEKNNIDEAISELEAAESSGVSSFNLHSILGYLYNEKAMTAKCIEQYQKATKIQPSDTKTLQNLGELFYNVENYDKAVFYYSELLKYNPDDNALKAQYAACVWKQGEASKAKEIFNGILDSPTGNKFRNYNAVAWVLIDKEIDIEWGIKIASAAYELKSRNIESADILGWGYYKQKDYVKAVEYLNQSMNILPSDEVKRRLTMAKEKLDESLKK
jgi:tetratricopeptide (TPR) repeat protein